MHGKDGPGRTRLGAARHGKAKARDSLKQLFNHFGGMARQHRMGCGLAGLGKVGQGILKTQLFYGGNIATKQKQEKKQWN